MNAGTQLPFQFTVVPPRALRPDRNFAAWVHLPRLGSAPLIGFLANIHRKIGRKTLIWQICCECLLHWAGIFAVLTFSKFLLYIRQYSEPRIEGITGSCFLAS